VGGSFKRQDRTEWERERAKEEMEASTSSAAVARQTWEIENNIPMDTPSGDSDAIFEYDDAAQSAILQQKPWTRDPHYFKNVKISALALLKMVVHARSGGTIEIMGLMQGKTDGETIIIMDAFALPVEGTETRVNAQADAYEYMVQYSQTNKQVGRLENVVGWYHSHPGYGCWLSGIDVSTQMLNQTYQEPFLAVVIDPTRTVSAGKVEIGAFRTYPQGHKPPDEPPSEYQTIPLNKIEDFGVHYKQYYSLDITYFKSTLDSHLLDLLWNKYWVNTLSSSPLLGNRDYVAGQVADLAEKLEQAESQLAHSGRMGGFFMPVQRKKEVWKAIDSSAISYVFAACSLCSIIICPEHMSKQSCLLHMVWWLGTGRVTARQNLTGQLQDHC
jgi:COP9 signalosome complex subunit 5